MELEYRTFLALPGAGFFNLSRATSLGKKNFEFKPIKPRLKIDLVSRLALAERLVNIYMH